MPERELTPEELEKAQQEFQDEYRREIEKIAKEAFKDVTPEEMAEMERLFKELMEENDDAF